MSTVRLNITIPAELADKMKGLKNKSSLIAEAVTEYINRREKEITVSEMRKGYKAVTNEDSELAKEWDKTSGDAID